MHRYLEHAHSASLILAIRLLSLGLIVIACGWCWAPTGGLALRVPVVRDGATELADAYSAIGLSSNWLSLYLGNFLRAIKYLRILAEFLILSYLLFGF